MRTASEVKVGDTYALSKENDKYRSIRYAGASGDFNPIHLDDQWAQMMGLPGRILHGLCNMAWMAQCHTDFAGAPGALKKLTVRFSKPVKVEDTIRYEAKVVAIEGNRVRVSCSAKNQDGEDVLTKGEAELELS